MATRGELRSAYMREYRKANAEKMKGYELKKHHGITYEDYKTILKNQGGVCAICGVPPGVIGNGSNPNSSLAVDHSHTLVGVRGLLCTNCNLGLGSFFENPSRLRRAADYLENHEQLVTKVRAGVFSKTS